VSENRLSSFFADLNFKEKKMKKINVPLFSIKMQTRSVSEKDDSKFMPKDKYLKLFSFLFFSRSLFIFF
jgi:hypothetical protein